MLDKIKLYAKRHTFHFIMIVAILISLGLHVSHYGLFATTNAKIDGQWDKTNTLVSKTSENTIKTLREVEKTTNDKLTTFNATTNARIDTIDSAIKPALKRRELLKLVRDSITENVDRTLEVRYLNRVANAVIDYGYEFNLPIAMVLAQIKQESDFDQMAKSHANAKGLMQIIDTTADEIAGDLGIRRYNIWDVKTNVRFGCYYMAKMLERRDNHYEDALRSYNFGPHHVDEVKAGDRDYSLSKIDLVDGLEVQFLVDKYGKYIMENDNRVVVKEEHKYPRETRNYVKRVKVFREKFATYGLDKIE